MEMEPLWMYTVHSLVPILICCLNTMLPQFAVAALNYWSCLGSRQMEWSPSLLLTNVHNLVHNILIDGFQSIFSLWQLEGKGSCDVDIGQSAGSMVM